MGRALGGGFEHLEPRPVNKNRKKSTHPVKCLTASGEQYGPEHIVTVGPNILPLLSLNATTEPNPS